MQVTDGKFAQSPIGTVQVQVMPVNDPAKISSWGTTLNYTLGTANPRLLSNTITVADVDQFNGSFNGGYLELRHTGVSQTTDHFGIASMAAGPGQVSKVGNDILFEGTIVGSFASDGLSGTALRINWNANATAANIQAVARRLTYRSSTATPDTQQRSLVLQLVDGAGLSSNLVAKTINFVP
jgi:hypothetical protein